MSFMKWSGNGNKKSGDHSMTLSDVVRGMQYCVNSCIEIVERHYLNTIQKFVTEEDGIETKRIYLDKTHYMDIPLICLTDHHALEIDQMKVKMKVNIRDMDLKQTISEPEGGEEGNGEDYALSRTSMLVDVCNVSKEDDNTNMEIEMTFKSGNPPESLSRMLETLNNNLILHTCEAETTDQP